MAKIDLNSDLGESFGNYALGDDDAVLRVITSANVACGMHAGDPLVIDRTVRLAKLNDVSIGAHPGYPDLQGFGRRAMDLTPEEAEAFTLYQLAAVAGFTKSVGRELVHVKPHGALYNQAARDAHLAAAVANGVRRFSRELILVGLAGSALLDAGRQAGLRVAAEGFPDRAYNLDGSLRSRREPGAVLHSLDEICQHAVSLALEGIRIQTGNQLRFEKVDTLCIHGDHAGAAEHAAAVRAALVARGVTLTALPNL